MVTNRMAEPECQVEYLEKNIFPILLPALDSMLRAAMNTERRKLFSPLDYLVEYLYKANPNHSDREDITFEKIPFVENEWSSNPRPSLPLSATLTEEQAATIIQSAYRAYTVRCKEKAQLFRQWQKGFRKEIEAVITIQRCWREYCTRKHDNR